MQKRFLGLVISIVFITIFVFAISVNASQITNSGQCGDNLTWTLDDEGTLTISGEGDMWDFWALQFGGNGTPWGDVGDDIKKVVIEEGVTSIGEEAFSGFGQNRCFFKIEELHIANTVKKIGRDSFFAGLQRDVDMSVSIPDSVEYIDFNAFGYNENVKLIFTENSNLKYAEVHEPTYNDLPDGATYIGKCLYAYKGEIGKSFKIKDGTVSIAAGAFDGCANLEELENIEAPDSLAIVDCSEFENTKWYETQSDGIVYLGKIAYGYKGDRSSEITADIKEGTIGIANHAFYDYRNDACNIVSLTLPDSIEYIGNYAFYNTPVGEVSLPEKLKYIGDGAFGITKTSNISIPSGVEYMGSDAFSNTDNAVNIQVDAANRHYCMEDGILFNKSKTVIYNSWGLSCDTYELPATVKIIHSLSGARNFIINEGVEHIDNWVIGPDVESIVLPKSLKTIGGYNLYNVSRKVYYRGSENDWNHIYISEFCNWLQCDIVYNAIGMKPPKIIGKPEATVAGNQYTVNVQLQDAEYGSNIITVLYDDGIVTGSDFGIISAGDTEKTISVDADSANMIKVFIWDGLSSMLPLCAVTDVVIQ